MNVEQEDTALVQRVFGADHAGFPAHYAVRD